MKAAGVDENTVFRSLFAAYPDSLLLVDMSGRIVLSNPSAAKLLGYTTDEIKGLSVEDLVPDSIRSKHASYRAAYGRNPRARPMGTQMDLVAKRRDGSEVLVEIALSPLQDQGLPYVVAAIRDIGAYPRVKQALQRARYAEHIAQMSRLAVDTRGPGVLVRQIPAAAAQALQVELTQVFLLEPDGLCFRLAGGEGLLPEEPLGVLLTNRPDTLPGSVGLLGGKPRLDTDRTADPCDLSCDIYAARGLVSGLAVPLLDKGQVVGVLAVHSPQPQRFGEDETRFLESLANLLTTILQRSQSEEALRHAQRLESVGQLTGGIAHDFNNLLTVIQGNMQVLEDLPTISADDYAQQLLDSAMRATRRGAELTGKLLAFSRRQVLQPRRVDIGAMLQSLANMLRRTLDQRLHIRVDVAADCPACLADPGQLEAALLNIAINARDAMPEGGTLTFSARRAEVLPAALREELATDTYVAIAIADSGIGMSEAVKERAFEPFFTTKEAGRGTGLGLATVYGFAKQSKGAVSIDSTPGQGTTLTLYIPEVSDAAAARPNRQAAMAGPTPGLRVLLVEDEPEVLRVVQAFLGGWQCEVTALRSAEQALALLQAEGAHYELLLTDIVLGAGMRGTELAMRARTLHPAMAVLLMSGYASDLLTGEAPPAAQTDLLRKPFTREALAAAISTALAR